MTAHVQIEEDLLGRHLHVRMAKSHGDGGGVAYSFPAPMLTLVQGNQTAPETEPLRLDNDMAHALFEALRKHFGAAPETTSLRSDFEYERGRTDKLIDALIEVAK